MEGFIYIHRQLLESAVFSSPNYLKIWLWILLKANYKSKSIVVKTGGGETVVDISRGQFIFGRIKAQQELDLSGSMIYRAMKKFEEWGMITIKSNNQYSLVTVCKYNDYQKEINNDEQRVNSERTASEQRVNSERTASEQRVNTTNKDNKENKEKNKKEKSAHVSFPTIEQCRQVAQMSGHKPEFGESYFYMRDADGWCKPRGRGDAMQMVPIANWRSDYANCYNNGYLKPKNNNEPTMSLYD